ncbi:MAG: hypothetical protein Q9M89_00800 [Persephonella sp.]|nr:hypothetical protein [Persephonella sp.]
MKLKGNVSASTQIKNVFKKGDIIIIAVPTQHIRNVLKDIDFPVDKPAISASKGIEIDTLKLISDVIYESLKIEKKLIFALSGPSFAKEVALGLPTAVTLGGEVSLGEKLQISLNTQNFRLYLNEDIKGVQIGELLKTLLPLLLEQVTVWDWVIMQGLVL